MLRDVLYKLPDDGLHVHCVPLRNNVTVFLLQLKTSYKISSVLLKSTFLDQPHKGIIAIMDEACLNVGKVTDTILLEEMYRKLKGHKHYSSRRSDNKKKIQNYLPENSLQIHCILVYSIEIDSAPFSKDTFPFSILKLYLSVF